MKKYYEVSVSAAKVPIFFEALNGAEYDPGQKVIVEGARGRELGTITDSPPVLSSASPNRTAALVSAANPSVPSIIVEAFFEHNSRPSFQRRYRLGKRERTAR